MRAYPQGTRETNWGGANALAVIAGGTTEDLRYLKSISLHNWLFGYELPGAVAATAVSRPILPLLQLMHTAAASCCAAPSSPFSLVLQLPRRALI